jgi:hypothetical protein
MKRVLLVLPFVLFVACSKDDPPGTGVVAGGDAGDTDAGTGTTPEAGGGSQCTAARESSLKPIDKVSTGVVSIVSEDGSAKVVYVDASAGGSQNASRNPAVYINLETAERIDVTDKSALESTDWDLSLKRTIIYTNSGDGGPGAGGAARLTKAFDEVTVAEGTMATEKFFDEECNALLDEANFLTTTFSPSWYDYEQTATIPVTPKPNVTYVVTGGTGKKYKVAIQSYKGKPDGTETAPSGGYFLLRVAPL